MTTANSDTKNRYDHTGAWPTPGTSSFQKSLFVRCIEKPLRLNHCQWLSPASLNIQLQSPLLPGNGWFEATATTRPRAARRNTNGGGYFAAAGAADFGLSASGCSPTGKAVTASPFSSNVV